MGKDVIKKFQKWRKEKSPFFNSSTIRLEEIEMWTKQVLRKQADKHLENVYYQLMANLSPYGIDKEDADEVCDELRKKWGCCEDGIHS